MTQPPAQHTGAWTSFAYAAFGLAVVLMLAGIWLMPTDIWLKGYFVMGTAMLVQTSITLAKTVRDAHENAKLVNRIEDARTERLLMGMDAN
jgi:hypothetical protein